jgi:hypothetical protein
MIFNMDDFSKDSDFYDSIPLEKDLGDFKNIMMHLTSVLKNINYEEPLKSGHELMMKVFNMTELAGIEENEKPLNVVMALISHLFAVLIFTEDKEEYFNFFDQVVMYPMLEEDI